MFGNCNHCCFCCGHPCTMLGVSLFISCKNKIQCVCVEKKKKQNWLIVRDVRIVVTWVEEWGVVDITLGIDLDMRLWKCSGSGSGGGYSSVYVCEISSGYYLRLVHRMYAVS